MLAYAILFAAAAVVSATVGVFLFTRTKGRVFWATAFFMVLANVLGLGAIFAGTGWLIEMWKRM